MPVVLKEPVHEELPEARAEEQVLQVAQLPQGDERSPFSETQLHQSEEVQSVMAVQWESGQRRAAAV